MNDNDAGNTRVHFAMLIWNLTNVMDTISWAGMVFNEFVTSLQSSRAALCKPLAKQES